MARARPPSMSEKTEPDAIADALRTIDPVRDRNGQPIYAPGGEQVTRSACVSGERPCPRVTCRQNLLPDQLARGGRPGPFTCAMDAVDAHPEGMSRNAVGVLMVRHQNEVRDIEERALLKFAPAVPVDRVVIRRRSRAKRNPSVNVSTKLPPWLALRVLDDAKAAGKPVSAFVRDVLAEVYSDRPRKRVA